MKAEYIEYAKDLCSATKPKSSFKSYHICLKSIHSNYVIKMFMFYISLSSMCHDNTTSVDMSGIS